MQIQEMTKEQLLEIVKRLPLTADGVAVAPGMRMWQLTFSGRVKEYSGNSGMHNSDILDAFKDCYSTPEAAAAARATGGGT